mmetsp:Transcript_46367/g.100829  ORF Transcript_46367/g.100829 Transcript_46367/m.100829 type:complete len:664 (-) Transcript_46367:80-2071(-)
MSFGTPAPQRCFADLLKELNELHEQEVEELRSELRTIRKESFDVDRVLKVFTDDQGNDHDLWPQWTQEQVVNMPRNLNALLRRGGSDSRIRKLSPQGDSTAAGCLESLMILPASKKRMFWDMLGLFFLAFDFIWIPMQVFDPPDWKSSQILEMATLIYWTADIPTSFCTAFVSKLGTVVRQITLIASRYIKTWFFLDLLLVATEWAAIALIKGDESGEMNADSAGLLRIGKILRAARIVRSLRLLRMMKMRQILFALQEHIDSEWMSIAFSTTSNMLTLLAVNHYVACFWFWLGKSSKGDESWVDFYAVRERDFGAKYVVSLHWSLTQFTPASMQVLPRNVKENAFAVIIIVCGLLGFSTFVSSITAAITRLRGLTSSDMAKSFMLRRFLKENSISHDLAGRLTRYIHLAVELHRSKVYPEKVELLAYLSGPMHVELRKELFSPYLGRHMFFSHYSTQSNAAMSQLCFSAVSKQSLSKGDSVFSLGSTAQAMYFLVSGTLFYERPKGIRWNLKTTIAGKDPRLKTVVRGSYFCEAVLWTPWFHRGTMGTLIESEVIQLDAAKFRDITQQHRDVFAYAKEYANRYLLELMETIEQVGVIWDLPQDIIHGAQTVQKMGDPLMNTEGEEIQAAELLHAYCLAESSDSDTDVKDVRVTEKKESTGSS